MPSTAVVTPGTTGRGGTRDPRGDRRLWLGAILWAVASLVALAWAMSAMHLDRTPNIDAGAANLGHLKWMWIASASGWAALTVMYVVLLRREGGESAGWSGRGAVVLLLIAIGVRGAVLLTHDPSLSDDIWRYVFDGRNLAEGWNPYLVLPEDRMPTGPDAVGLPAPGLEERWPGESAVVERMNNRELHTIYLPVSQLVFAGASVLVGDDESNPASPEQAARAVRLVITAFELAAIGFLLLMLRAAGRSPWWGALYAWHPLAITEFAGSGHQDAIGLAFLMMALYLGTRKTTRTWLWAGYLGLGSLVKPVVAPAAVFLLRCESWREWGTALLVGIVVCGGVSAPFLMGNDGTALTNLRETSTRFTLKWDHFSSVYAPALWSIEAMTNDPDLAWERPEDELWTNDDQEQLARLICTALAALAIVLIWRWVRDPWRATMCMFLVFILFSPSAHPWYLLWSLVLLPMCPGSARIPRAGAWAVWAASLTLPWGYVVLGDVIEWTVPAWVVVVAYAPIYGALAAEWITARRRVQSTPQVRKQ